MWQEGAKLLARMDPRFKGLNMEPKDALDFVVQMVIPLQRYQTAEDIGNAAVFLASHEAKEITGQAINVCGGMHFA
jgi:enoyl-[acyl-carrier-protein] reductase (NADH)